MSGGSSDGTQVTSSSNTFTNVLPGASLQINSASGEPVSITVGNDGTNIATDLQTFVTNYNSFRSQLTTDTAYNTTTETGSVLSNDTSALQLDVQLSQLVTAQFAGSGPVQSLADVGITVQSNGTLTFDQSQFQSAWDSDPKAVQQMFTAAKTGVSAQFDTLINQLAGQDDNSLLASKSTALQNEISDNEATITQMNQRLDDEQNLLYTEFYNMDLTIGKLKSSQSVISAMYSVAPISGPPAQAVDGMFDRPRPKVSNTEGTTSAIIQRARLLLLYGCQDGYAAEAAVVAHRGGLAVGQPGRPALAAGSQRFGPSVVARCSGDRGPNTGRHRS